MNNKLIAEFMGAKPLVLGGSTEYEMYGVLDCIEDGVDEKHYYIDDEMRFHESWDWLMPVLKKINLKLNPDTYGAWRMINRPTEYNIEEVYAQVVRFIKQYNDATSNNTEH